MTKPAEKPDYWERIKADDQLANARRKLSMHELRLLFQHARDSLQSPPFPSEPSVKLTTDIVPYSSIVGGGLCLKGMKGQAAFIVNFIGTSQGITKQETQALTEQFSWFVHTFGCRVPERT